MYLQPKEHFYPDELSYFVKKMEVAFKEEVAKDIRGTVQLEIFSGNSKPNEIKENWVIDIKNKKCSIYEGEISNYDTLIKLKKKDFIHGMLGKEAFTEIFSKGTMGIFGDFDLAAYLNVFFEQPDGDFAAAFTAAIAAYGP